MEEKIFQVPVCYRIDNRKPEFVVVRVTADSAQTAAARVQDWYGTCAVIDNSRIREEIDLDALIAMKKASA